jgi:hypothetical protein
MAFSAGFDATFSIGGTDISAYTTSVKFNPVRKEYDLEVLAGNAVKAMVGPVKTTIDVAGFIDPTLSTIFTNHMAESPPASAAIAYSPQGPVSGSPHQTCNAFVVEYDEDTASNGPGKWTAKLAVDGLVTFGSN